MPTVINPDGTITWSGLVTFANYSDFLTTGIATFTLTPNGGASNLPPLVQGDPGLPPTFRNVVTNTLDPATIPTPTQSVELTLVDPGSAGHASVYDITFNVLKGAKGDTGAMGHLLGSSDFTNTGASGQIPVYNATGGPGGTAAITWTTPHPVTGLYVVPGTSFSALTETSAGARDIVVSQIIPAQSFNYRPCISGDLEVTGAVGMRIDAEVRMGPQATALGTTAVSGVMVGYGRGAEGVLPVHLDIREYYGGATAMAVGDLSPAAVVPSGQAQAFVLSAVRQYGSASWTTAQTLGELRIRLEPV